MLQEADLLFPAVQECGEEPGDDSAVYYESVITSYSIHYTKLYDSSTGDLKAIESIKGVQVYEINGPFFFGAAETFINTFRALDPKTKAIILRMRHVPMIDATAAAALKNVAERCTKQNIRLIITGLKEELRGTLKTSGIEQLRNNFV